MADLQEHRQSEGTDLGDEFKALTADPRSSGGSSWAAILLGTIGVLGFIVQPGLVQGFVTELRVDAAVANDLAFREMLGIAIATIIATLIGDHVSWRVQAAIALAVASLGNILSALAPGLEMLFLARLLAGLGAGFVISISFTVIGTGARPERGLGLYLVSLLTYGAIGLWVMPSVLAAFGLQAIFWAWAIASALAIFAAFALPTHIGSRDLGEVRLSATVKDAPTIIILAFLLGVFVYNTSVSIAWANLFLIGLDAKIAEQDVANALLICQFTAIAGALAAVSLAEKFSSIAPIVIGTLGGAAVLALVLGAPSFAMFLATVILFNTIWNFAMPFILGLAPSLTATGRLMSVAVAVQMAGLAFGPLLASAVLGETEGFETIKWFGIALMLVALFLLVPAMIDRGRRRRAGA
jgi:predicted MFS family arabinose efflux permease